MNNMVSQFSTSGFYKTPISKILIGAVASVSSALIVAGPVYKSHFIYSPESIFDKLQLWRLITCKLGFIDTRDLILSLMLIYYFRIFERRFGSAKYASYLLANAVLCTGLEVVSLAACQHFDVTLSYWTPGLHSVLLSLIVPFYLDVPHVSLQRGGVIGHIVTGKVITYIVALQLATGNRCSNILAGCGILSGLLYRANFFYIQSWLRIPNFVSRFCSNYLLPLVQSRPPEEGAVPMGATLEIQQQQRMEVLEQQMLLSQARQFSRQRNRAVRFARPSGPFQRRAFGNLLNPGRNRPRPPEVNGNADDVPATASPSNGNVDTAASSPSVSASPEKIQQLVDMGFNRGAVTQALRATDDDIAMATNLLLQE
ncbi:ubiquitin-associated domain-containing protein 2-like [Amphiura filiformis]|uniref:ubiquitin-associated domain-containing protein 2-like n=1 Tax=Amphiura filiformis TaxID=82378 RepID=UPI003B222946